VMLSDPRPGSIAGYPIFWHGSAVPARPGADGTAAERAPHRSRVDGSEAMLWVTP